MSKGMTKGKAIQSVLWGILGIFLAILVLGGFVRAFGGIGLVFAMLAVFAVFAVAMLVVSIRNRKVSPSGFS